MTAIEQKMNKIATLSSVLLSTLDEGIFFAKLSSHVREIFPNDRVQIYIAGSDESSKMIAENGVVVNDQPELEKGKGFAGHVIRTKRAYYSNSVKRDPLLSSMEYDQNINAELGMPINVDGSIIGTIQIQSESEDRNFSESDISGTLEVLNDISNPLSNMKMYLMAKNLNHELLKKIEEHEKELTNKQEIESNGTQTLDKSVFIGNSMTFHSLMNQISKIAKSDSNVLVKGEPGTGKELAARRIHTESARRNGPLVMVTCSAIKEPLLEAELFGVEKGVFGANNEREGLLERANGGILILDEVCKLSLLMQAKLLRFIESGTAYRVGSHRPYVANVRILSLTNKDIVKEVEEGRFREDLLYRINSVLLPIPALAERRDDVGALAEYFLNEEASDADEKSLTYTALEVLKNYNWPGNIRELKNVMERVRVLSDGMYIDVRDLPDFVKEAPQHEEENLEEIFSEMALEILEKKHICKTLEHLDGNKTKTAKSLGITVKTLYNKLHSYGMVQPRS